MTEIFSRNWYDRFYTPGIADKKYTELRNLLSDIKIVNVFS